MPRHNQRRPRTRGPSGDRSGSLGGRGGRRAAARGAGSGSGDSTDPDREIAGGWRTEEFRGGVWAVRPVSGARAVKAYRCPGCSQQIAAGVPHVVVWPFETPIGLGDGVGDRRHWHTSCWAARERRAGR